MKDLVFSVAVPAKSRYLGAIRSFLAAVLEDLFGEGAKMLVLAVDESCANVLKHGSNAEEPLRVRVEVGREAVRFRIDNFCGVGDVSKIRPRDLGEVRPGGLGTHFVGEIMDRVAYEPDPDRADRLCLVLEKVIPRGER